MSFEIGTRVKSVFCGTGTITSGILAEEFPADPRRQVVKFDSEIMGERAYPIGKLDRVGDDDGT